MTRGRKPKPEGTIRTKTNGNIEQKRGKKWIYIGCDSELKKKANAKFQKEPWEPNFPPVTLPDHIRPTKYPHYYISNDGVAYREPRRCDENGRYGEVNEWGLIQLTTHLRGNPNCGEEKMYESVNIYFYDEDGRNVGLKKKTLHQLVAETWIPNPHGYIEVLHGKKGNRCNHYTNLRWGTHKQNMEEASHTLPEGSIRYHKGNSCRYIKKNGEWVLIPKVDKETGKYIPWNKGKTYKMPEEHIPWNKGKKYSMPSQQLPAGTVKTRTSGATFKKVDGKWVYQRKERNEKVDRVYESTSDGTITIRADGTKWKKENGKWVYQKKLKK